MAHRELSGNLVTMQFSTDLVDPYNNLKTIVCEESSDGGVENSVTTTPTKCESFSTTGTPSGSVNGSGVLIANPDGSEASFQDLLVLAKEATRVFGVYMNAADSPDVTEGQGAFMAGFGYFSNVRTTNDQGTQSKFNWTFNFTGTIDVYYPGSAPA